MSAPATETLTPRPAAPAALQPSSQEVDASCRVPLVLMLTSSVIWLVLAQALTVFASIKSHAPGMMAGTAELTFGRLAGAASTVFFYGFASQAAIAISIWLFARMGRALMVLPRVSIAGALLWNLAVLIAFAGILGGGMTHYPGFEMPSNVWIIFFAAYALLGLSAILTFHARTERKVYPANWFIFAGLFVFPWIFSTAGMILGHEGTRPVLEPVVSTWFFNNFLWLWLGSAALGIIYYFIPKLSGQPLYSYATVAFAFWCFIAFANASGFQNIAAVPGWMPATSQVANVLLFVPAAAIALTWHKTWRAPARGKKQQKEPAAGYIVFAAFGFLASILFLGIVSFPMFDEVLGFSIFLPGLVELIAYGFIGMALFGAMVYILPRLTEVEWPRPGLVSWHFRLTVGGLIISVAALMLGGWVHGSAMNNLAVDFTAAVRRAVPFIGVSTLGLLAVLAGQVLLLVNLISMLKNCCGCCGVPGRKEGAR